MASPAADDDGASFIHAARRKQLVECAIEVIAEVGLARASTVRIAQRAGVSRGVLTYHFRDRAELVEQVIQFVYDLGAEVLGPKLARAGTPRELMLTFIGGSVELYAAHPTPMAALTEIYADARGADGVSRASHRRHSQERSDVSAVLRAGQEQGQFRAFDVDVMYSTIRAALDAALAYIAGGGSVEPYASELQAIFDAATTPEVKR
ncbi:MAG TPA: TetR family transcriptional regulator [Pseudonocardiaceae bacterium]|nr:TetR family transcriptional regulator [Pseudonocardiaceae bacterium]